MSDKLPQWKVGDLISASKMNAMVDAINEIEVTQGEQGPKGDQGPKGEQGPKGDTPIKGVDYFTEEDKEELLAGYATKSYVDSEIAKAQLEGGEVDLKGYATKDELNAKADIEDIPTKTSELQNDSNFLTSIPSEYVTETELNNKDFATKSYVSSEIAKAQLGGGISELTEPAENDMPRLFLYDGVLPTTKDSVVMSFEYISKNKRFQGYVDIKCQGTSSMNYAKKNFTIKLFSDKALENKIKINFMNWGEQNKFCLKANWVDSTHTRNIVGARIGYDIVQSRPDSEFKRNLLTAPRCGLIDGFPIKLYYKGEFYGIYTWNIPKDAWQFAMDENNENHIVLCAEKNSDGKTSVINSCQFKALWTNGDKGDWSVEVGTYSNSLVEKWNRVISFVKDSSDEEFINNFEQYFDLYSVIDYYCFSYFMTNLDGLAKNMLVATYDGNIWGCSLYDMDTTVGAYWDSSKYVPYNYRCPEDYQEQFSLLWERVEKCFTQILCERYFALREKELSLANIINHTERLYDIIPDRVFNDEKIKWTNIPQVSTNTMTRVRNYLKDRAEYVDEQFNNLMNGEDEPDEPDEPDVPDTPQDDAIYTLGETQVLDGTSKYIDTGIALLTENIDYTIFVDFSLNIWQGKQKSLLHCMNEDSPYPGINLQTDKTGFILSGKNLSKEISTTSTNEYLIPRDTDVQHSVFVRREGDTITMITEVGRSSCAYTHNSVNKNLLIGAYQTSDGVVGRWLNCTVYQAKVWNRALSDVEVNNLMNGEDEPDEPDVPDVPDDNVDYLSDATWSIGSIGTTDGKPDTTSESAQGDVYTILYNLPVGMYTYSSTNIRWKKVSVVDETIPGDDKTLLGAHYEGDNDTNDITFPITEPNTKTLLSAFPDGITDLSELKLYRSDIDSSVTDIVDYNIPITSFVVPGWAIDQQPDDYLILEHKLGSLSDLTDDLPYLSSLTFGDAYTAYIIDHIIDDTDLPDNGNTPTYTLTLSTKCFTTFFEDNAYLIVSVPKSIFGDTLTDFFDYCTRNNISNAVLNEL